MSHPPNPASQAEMSAAFAGAVDLSSLQRPAGGAGNAAPADAQTPPAASGQSDSPYIMAATDATFEQVLQLSAQVPVVVDLWATWCQPCKQLGPVLEKLAVEGNGTWVLATVDVDANPGIAQAFQAQSIPTVVAVAGGKPVAAFQGAQPEPQVRQWIASLLDQLRDAMPGIKEAEAAMAAQQPEPEPEDPRLVAAREATDRGEYAEAARQYQDILDAEPGHAEAASGLAWSQLFARAAEVPDDAAARSDENPADVDAAIAAADSQVAGGAVAAAFARLIKAVSLTAGEERGRAREHLLGLFDLFAADDPEVASARKALTAALF